MIHWHFKAFDYLTSQELYEIIRLRVAVFVIEQDAPYQDCDRVDYESHHIYATDGDEIMAYARIIPPGITYTEPCLGRVVLSPESRGNGYGRTLVYLALQAMETIYKTTDCRISAQLYLQEFYESFGFKRVSDVYLEDGLPHVEMVK
ncbi:MAG: GNAT family N-acetyltransferase [Weeksellaceae bacterium]